VPDAVSSPNSFPPNFFNVNSPRGTVFATPGTGFQVSANAASGTPIEFGNINPTYPTVFTTFSAPRLFTAIGSTITDVNFFVPGSTLGAFTTGFGAVFTDVNVAGSTTIQFFDLGNNLINTVSAPATTGNEMLSFVGVQFTTERIGRVRVTSGNQILGPGATTGDVVVMDDFIYGEPTIVPEPSTLGLLGLGLAGLLIRRIRA